MMGKLQNLPTPFYFYDIELLRATLKAVKDSAAPYNYKVHYALKANFDSRILEEVRQAGLGADCVSGNEVRAAIECGIPSSEVVFAGVGKSDSEINYALEQKIFSFNCESREELEVLNELAEKKGCIANIALRVNPDVDPKTHAHISTGKADNKFGISYTEVDEVVAQIDKLQNINIVGLHFHIGSQIRDMEVFEKLCKRINEIKGWFIERGIKIEHLNMGGGLGIDYDDPDAEPIPDFAALFDIVNKNLEVEAGQTVHFELGRSIVAQCGELISRVLYNKTTPSGKQIVIIDAGMTDLLRPALYGAKHKVENLSSKAENQTYTVVGPICESSDTFAKDIELPATKRGDIIAIRSAGAYGMAMASNYNLRDLPKSVYSL